ncbi:MAG TPA: tryptophan halogenase family protein [Steroidobacteraceae bacterium]
MSEPIRKIVVAGSGAVAWITAAALRRALARRELDVCVVDTGADGAPAGWWTLPSQRGMHALLGINESHFIQETGATFRLGTEHRGWQGDGSRFLHAHGDLGTELGGTPFYRYLQAESVDGRPSAPEEWSLAGMAARLGRFARPMGKDLTASFTYGYHLDDARYAAYLRTLAERLGVRVGAAPWADTQLAEGGRIARLRLADGSTIEADLFIDCSGATAKLIGAIAPDREDWSAWLPCDRMLSGFAPAQPDLAALTQTVAGEAGWSWRAPLAARSLVGFVYSSRFLGDEQALAAFASSAPELDGDPGRTRFSAGRRQQFWSGNCLALGAAAMELEPLAGAALHFAQVGLATLVELFPRSRDSRVESVEYNRVMREQADALRDFTLAHYLAGRARPGEMWAAIRGVEPPARLAHKLALYSSNGRLVLQDHETFEETDWAWLLLGSGCVPAAVEAQVRGQLANISPRDLQALHTRIQQLAASMPTHAEFVRHQSAPAPAAR